MRRECSGDISRPDWHYLRSLVYYYFPKLCCVRSKEGCEHLSTETLCIPPAMENRTLSKAHRLAPPTTSSPQHIFRKLLGKEGWPRDFISKVPLYLSVFSTGHNRLFRMPLTFAKKVSFAIVQRLGKGMPAVAGAETWAFKNTMLAVQVKKQVMIMIVDQEHRTIMSYFSFF